VCELEIWEIVSEVTDAVTNILSKRELRRLSSGEIDDIFYDQLERLSEARTIDEFARMRASYVIATVVYKVMKQLKRR